jgi:hypothetical protein
MPRKARIDYPGGVHHLIVRVEEEEVRIKGDVRAERA